MFTTINHPTNKVQNKSSLSNNNVTGQVLDEALEKVSLLTGLNQAESLALLTQQLLKNYNSVLGTALVNSQQQIPVAVLEHNEIKFISNLFH